MDCFTAEWSTAIYNVTDPTIENQKETRTGSLFPFSFTKRCSQIVLKKRTASRSKVNGIGQHSNKLKETTTTQISGFSRTTAKGIVYACRVNTGAVGRACVQCVRSFLLIDVIFFWPGFFLAERGGGCVLKNRRKIELIKRARKGCVMGTRTFLIEKEKNQSALLLRIFKNFFFSFPAK